MIGQIYTSQYVQPFIGKLPSGKKSRAVKKLKDTGVYIIRENGKIVYIGMSQSCVVEALYRHFYYYNDTHRKPRTYYNPDNGNEYTVYILYTTKDDAPKLEKGLILAVNPRDNREKYQSYLDQLSVQNIEQHQAEATAGENITDLPF